MELHIPKNRTHNTYLELGRKAQDLEYKEFMNNFDENKQKIEKAAWKATKGIWGISKFAEMTTSNLSEIFPVQNMHLLWENTVPLIMRLLFSPEYSQEDFSSNSNLQEIDERIAQADIPFGEKKLKTISELFDESWKARDARFFCLFFSVSLMKGLVPDIFLLNWAKFVRILTVFSSSVVFEDDAESGQEILNNFYIFSSNFFHQQNITVQIHEIIHLPKYIRLCGPFWVLSGFICENETGNWVRSVTGSNCSQDFMIFLYSMRITLCNQALSESIEKQTKYTKEIIQKVAPFLLQKKKQKARITIPKYDGWCVHGCCEIFELNSDMKNAFSIKFNVKKLNVPPQIPGFKKVSSPFGIIASLSYKSKRAICKDSSWVKFEMNGEMKMGQIANFFKYLEKIYAFLQIHSYGEEDYHVDEFERKLVQSRNGHMVVVEISQIRGALIMLDVGEMQEIENSQKRIVSLVDYVKPSIGEQFTDENAD